MKSYVQRVSDQPLSGETIGAAFDRVANAHAEHEALVVCHQGVRWSYRELQDRVDRLAANLMAFGFEHGDRIRY
jgi:fatty-acyl-CoA synthase